MFASSFLTPSQHYIRGPGDKEIPVAKMNRCGIMVYAITAIMFLVTLISYLTLPSYQVEVVTMSPTPIEGQNCTILAAFSGGLEAIIHGNAALSDADMEFLGKCTIDSTVESGSMSTTSLLCPDKSQYADGSTIKDTYFGGACDLSKATNAALINKLADIIKGFKCGSIFLYDEAKWSITEFGAKIYAYAKAMYFPTYESCLNTLKVNSVKLNRFPMKIKPTFSSTSFKKDCELTVNAASLEWDFSPKSPMLSDPGFGPKGIENIFENDFPSYWTNLVCDGDGLTYTTGDSQKCGIPSTEACPGFDSAQMLNFFNLLYPTFTEDVCSAFKVLPPYQCINTHAPSFVSALGSTLAIMNTLLGALFAAAVYMFQNGYELPGVFGSGSGSDSGSSDTGDTSGKTADADAKEVELGIDVNSKPGDDAMVDNPMSNEQLSN